MSVAEQARGEDRAALEGRAQALYEDCVQRRTDPRDAARRIANAVIDELEFAGPAMRAAARAKPPARTPRKRAPKAGGKAKA